VTELEKPGTGATPTRARQRNRRWPALIGGLVLAVLKSQVVLRLIVHRGSLIAVLVVLLFTGLLKVRPVSTAAAAALLAALVVGVHSLGLGLALGFGGFALLMALFFSISTVLHARQDHGADRPWG
jgi:hypothetical protein